MPAEAHACSSAPRRSKVAPVRISWWWPREKPPAEPSRQRIHHHNVEERSMEQITVESIPILVGREDDGRWWADIESMPGVMAYGATRPPAICAVRALALRVAADCIDHGEEIPEPFTKVFSVA